WLTGNKLGLSWTTAEQKSSIYELKAYVENIFIRLGVNVRKLVFGEYADDLLSEALTVYSPRGYKLAVFGVVHPKVRKTIDID
ncbi:phenylalanine--tRNA ligase subunit beta, partial [bacterium]|nr:phenylalanine--tRNA ligase subunit beta [bacterium]